MRWSTRSTRGRSPTRTATGWVTSPGVTARLPYVAGLGVDAVWLTPFQRSPQADHGYDVSDYCDVDPLFGDLARSTPGPGAHDLGLRVLVDLVPNHCSTAHPLFRAALAAGPGSPERALFHFAPAAARRRRAAEQLAERLRRTGLDAGARARRQPGEWYLHLYAPEQPDWNWRDPRVGPMFDDVVRFWFDRGADGLRIDVAHGLFKAAGLPDLDAPGHGGADAPSREPLACDRIEVHEVYRRWRALADGYEQPRVLVGEANLPRPARRRTPARTSCTRSSRSPSSPRRGTPQAWTDAAVELLDVSADSGASTTWVVENHDVVAPPRGTAAGPVAAPARGPRSSRYSACRARRTSTRGRSSGCRRWTCPRTGARTPPGPATASRRDGCRVPMPWTADHAGAHGFSPDGGARAVAAGAGRLGSAVRGGAERGRRLNAGSCAAVRWGSGASCTATA